MVLLDLVCRDGEGGGAVCSSSRGRLSAVGEQEAAEVLQGEERRGLAEIRRFPLQEVGRLSPLPIGERRVASIRSQEVSRLMVGSRKRLNLCQV